MYPRTNYEMTEADMAEIMEACKPVPAIMIGGHVASVQENANNAWARLGRKMDFDHMTVRPQLGMGDRFFTAIPNETEEAKAERVTREAEERRIADIKQLEKEIAEREATLAKLRSLA